MKTFVLLLTLALWAIEPAARNAGKERDDGVSFAGTWETIAGDTDQYTVTLKQVGNHVTGSFSPDNGKIFAGVVSGNKLTFKWTKDEGFEGTAEFIMDEDGKGFTGSSTVVKPQELTVPWNGKRAADKAADADKAPEKVTPSPISFTGVWQAQRGTTPMTLELLQNGDQVTGEFQSDGAGSADVSLSEGIVVGNTLRFKFKLAPADRSARGSGELVLAEDGKSFKGYIAGVATSGTLLDPR